MQFDVHRYVGPARDRAPYLVDLQSDRARLLDLRVVAPLLRPSLYIPPSRLSPEVKIGDERLVISTAELFAIRRDELVEVVGNLERERGRIIGALDLLFTGI